MTTNNSLNNTFEVTGIMIGNGASATTGSTVTQHGVLLGGASNAVSSLGVASTGTVLAGATGADPAFTATPSVTSITLGAGTALSSYVQGTWTPVLNFNSATTGITYSTQFGEYTRIGNVLYFACYLILTSKGSATGAASITGFPVAAVSSNMWFGVCDIHKITLTASYTSVASQMSGSEAFLNIIGSGQTVGALDNTMFANDSRLAFTGFYFIT